jgi:exopolysaccharide biosynthesis polyprenyl glycosylphosphotransferase
MKRNRLIFSVILVPLDYLMLLVAATFAYRLRFETLVEYRPAVSLIPFWEYFQAIGIVAAVWIPIFALVGLYAIEWPRRVLAEAVKVVSGCTLGVMGIIILIFFRRELFTSRFVVLAAWLLAIACVVFGRLVVRLIMRFMFAKGIASHRVIIIGGSDAATAAIVGEFSRYPEKGYAIFKKFQSWNDEVAKEVEVAIADGAVDEILATDSELSRPVMQAIIEFAEDHHLTFRYAADTLATHAILHTTTIAGVPVIEVVRTRLDGWGRVYKRVFDIIVSFIILVLASPFMLLATIAVFLGSRGPVIFRNERVGHHGKNFDVLKFRTMAASFSVGSQFGDQKAALAYEQQLIKEQGIKEGPVYKIKDDPRVTAVGRLLRRYSIDELPQIFNVLKGDMSLVGPRPHQPREVAKYERRHRRVFTIRPGLTGLAQVSGRSDLSFEDENRLDVFYIENWSPLTDLAILFKTPGAVLRRKGAY